MADKFKDWKNASYNADPRALASEQDVPISYFDPGSGSVKTDSYPGNPGLLRRGWEYLTAPSDEVRSLLPIMRAQWRKANGIPEE